MITTEKELRKLIKQQNEILKQQIEKLKQLIQSLKEANSQTGTQPPDSP